MRRASKFVGESKRFSDDGYVCVAHGGDTYAMRIVIITRANRASSMC